MSTINPITKGYSSSSTRNAVAASASGSLTRASSASLTATAMTTTPSANEMSIPSANGNGRVSDATTTVSLISRGVLYCTQESCSERATFGRWMEDGEAVACSAHAAKGMVDMRNPRCRGAERCNLHPMFGFPKHGGRGEFCKHHRLEGMIDFARGGGARKHATPKLSPCPTSPATTSTPTVGRKRGRSRSNSSSSSSSSNSESGAVDNITGGGRGGGGRQRRNYRSAACLGPGGTAAAAISPIHPRSVAIAGCEEGMRVRGASGVGGSGAVDEAANGGASGRSSSGWGSSNNDDSNALDTCELMSAGSPPVVIPLRNSVAQPGNSNGVNSGNCRNSGGREEDVQGWECRGGQQVPSVSSKTQGTGSMSVASSPAVAGVTKSAAGSRTSSERSGNGTMAARRSSGRIVRRPVILDPGYPDEAIGKEDEVSRGGGSSAMPAMTPRGVAPVAAAKAAGSEKMITRSRGERRISAVKIGAESSSKESKREKYGTEKRVETPQVVRKRLPKPQGPAQAYRMCTHQGPRCTITACFGFPGQRRMFCNAHKLEGMINRDRPIFVSVHSQRGIRSSSLGGGAEHDICAGSRLRMPSTRPAVSTSSKGGRDLMSRVGKPGGRGVGGGHDVSSTPSPPVASAAASVTLPVISGSCSVGNDLLRRSRCRGDRDTCPLYGHFGFPDVRVRQYCSVHQLKGMTNLSVKSKRNEGMKKSRMNPIKSPDEGGGSGSGHSRTRLLKTLARKAGAGDARPADAEGKPARRRVGDGRAKWVSESVASDGSTSNKTSHTITCRKNDCAVPARFGRWNGRRVCCGAHKEPGMVNLAKRTANKTKHSTGQGGGGSSGSSGGGTAAAAAAAAAAMVSSKGKEPAKVREKVKVSAALAKGKGSVGKRKSKSVVAKARSDTSSGSGSSSSSSSSSKVVDYRNSLISTAGCSSARRGGKGVPLRLAKSKAAPANAELGSDTSGRVRKRTEEDEKEAEEASAKPTCTTPQCLEISCHKHPSFGFLGGRREYCREHGHPGMVNLVHLGKKVRMLKLQLEKKGRAAKGMVIDKTSLVAQIPGKLQRKRKRQSGGDDGHGRPASSSPTRKKACAGGSSTNSGGKGTSSSRVPKKHKTLHASSPVDVDLGAGTGSDKGKVDGPLARHGSGVGGSGGPAKGSGKGKGKGKVIRSLSGLQAGPGKGSKAKSEEKVVKSLGRLAAEDVASAAVATAATSARMDRKPRAGSGGGDAAMKQGCGKKFTSGGTAAEVTGQAGGKSMKSKRSADPPVPDVGSPLKKVKKVRGVVLDGNPEDVAGKRRHDLCWDAGSSRASGRASRGSSGDGDGGGGSDGRTTHFGGFSIWKGARCVVCNRVAKLGCSASSCFDCCVKSGTACEAHAKRLERKQREDELLAAPATHGSGGSEGGIDEDARLPKGAFKEVSFHATGETATLWCLKDFVCGQEAQAAMESLTRTERADRLAIYRGEVDALAKTTRWSSASGAFSNDHAAAAMHRAVGGRCSGQRFAGRTMAGASVAAASGAREKVVRGGGGVGRESGVPKVDGGSLRAGVAGAKWRRKHAELLAAVG